MALHSDETGFSALHQIAHHSDTDPTSTLGPYKAWFAPTSGILKIRNSANSAWVVVDAPDPDGLAPTGGTTGQVLKKDSGTNYDYSWQDDEEGTGGSADLEGLSDVDLTSPATRQGLFYDGTNFVNQMDPAQFVAPQSKTATFTASLAEYVYVCDASGGSFTANLPTAVGCAGKQFVFKKTDSSANTITLDPNGSQTINGDATRLLDNEGESVTLQSDGTNWHIVGIAYGGSGNAGIPSGGSTDDVLTKDSGTSYDYSWQAPSGGSSYRTLITAGSDVANATTTFADITGLTHSVASGTTYRFYALIVYTNSLTTVGASFSYNGPSATFKSHKAVWGGTSNTAQTVTDAEAYDVNNVSTAHGSQGTYTAVIEGIIKPSASGTLAMRFKSDGDGTITVKAGSTLEIW